MGRFTDSIEVLLGSGEPQTKATPTSHGGLFNKLTSSTDIKRDEPPSDDYERYRTQYKAFALARAALNIRAAMKVKNGYRITADNEDVQEFLRNWAKEMAIHAGEENQPLQPLLFSLALDLDKDGTVLLEHVYDNAENPTDLMALDQFDPDTVYMDQYPGTDRLLRPDEGSPPTDSLETKRGEVAAYVQYYGDAYEQGEIPLSQNDVTKLVRDPDGARGTSLMEAVSEEIERLRARMQDYNASIAAMAYPRMLLKFEDYELPGPEETVVRWDNDMVSNYMKRLERPDDEKKFTANGDWQNPGAIVASPPGVEAEIVKSQVPDISESLDYSIEQIILGLETPKVLLGYAGDINRDIAGDQIENFEQRLQAQMRQIERKLTKVFEKKAEFAVDRGEFSESEIEGIAFELQADDDTGPLRSDDLDVERLATFTQAMKNYAQGGADAHFPAGLIYEAMGVNPEEYDLPQDLEQPVDEENADVQSTFNRLQESNNGSAPDAEAD